MLEVGPSEVRFICDRRGGIGADGLLRAVLAKHIDGWTGDGALWFMDYRNADGSIAEMCGNGIRVFVRFLLDQGLVNGPVVEIATRSGLREATALPDGRIRRNHGLGRDRKSIGRRQYGRRSRIQGRDGRCRQSPCREFRGQSRRVVASMRLPDGILPRSFPHGVNLEFVRRLGPQHIAMRVYERGVGETRSCGTGTVAAAAAARFHDQDQTALPVTYRVDTPGGTVEVELTDHEAYLTGPAVLVAHGELALPDRADLETTHTLTFTASGASGPA